MNKPKAFIVNGDSVIGFIYFDKKRGRTIVLDNHFDINYPLSIYEITDDGQDKVASIEFIEFIQNMLPPV